MTQAEQAPQSRSDQTASRSGWFAMVLVGSIVTVLAGSLLAVSVATATLTSSHRDSGYLVSPLVQLSSPAYAITTPSNVFESPRNLPEIRFAVTVESANDDAIFVGIGPSADVADYLSRVHISEIYGAWGFPLRAQLRDRSGSERPEPPGEQDFWSASSVGAGPQELTWQGEEGKWTVVIMNADAIAGIDAKAAVGVEAPWAAPAAASVAVVAGILWLLGVTLVVAGAFGWGKRTPHRQPHPTATVPVYPSALTGDLHAMPSRWLWLVKWLLVIPHWIVLAFLWVAFVITTVAAGVAILFTGRYPRPLFEFTVGVLRWSWRVSFYSYSALGTDHYPPFSLDRANYPADFSVEYPERLSHGLVLVKWWLLAIPHLLIVGALTGTATYGISTITWGWGVPASFGFSVLGALVLIAAVILLFTGRYQRPLFDLIMGINRWSYRVATYVALMRDEYPPFRLDQGSGEPEVKLPRMDLL